MRRGDTIPMEWQGSSSFPIYVCVPEDEVCVCMRECTCRGAYTRTHWHGPCTQPQNTFYRKRTHSVSQNTRHIGMAPVHRHIAIALNTDTHAFALYADTRIAYGCHEHTPSPTTPPPF